MPKSKSEIKEHIKEMQKCKEEYWVELSKHAEAQYIKALDRSEKAPNDEKLKHSAELLRKEFEIIDKAKQEMEKHIRSADCYHTNL